MIPNLDLIKINDNLPLIKQFLEDLIIKPRVDIRKWSEITKQTPTLKIGYIGQHLTSLILGMEGGRTGARGHDIIDGTEVKSCTKVDQSDKCKDCGERLMRSEVICFNCESENIKRNDDSKWLFSIRSLEELNQYKELDRVFLLISDYPNFKDNDFTSVRFEAFEIYPRNPRMPNFNFLIDNHYNNIYLPKINNNQKTNPMNFHPYSFQFYLCNPIKIFSCIIDNIDTNATINITKYINPNVDRTNLVSEEMPIELLSYNELINFVTNNDFDSIIKPNLTNQNQSRQQLLSSISRNKNTWKASMPFLNEIARNTIPLREIVSLTQTNSYRRN
ncbi:MamI family restriction endonuclease [uncultured Flavobacterium sp.]|uniref:MamI family restriction endonuclease n=1 Tax=uncultured Flavobacterium sp. TaxID=165435 RepID=UPI0030C82147